MSDGQPDPVVPRTQAIRVDPAEPSASRADERLPAVEDWQSAAQQGAERRTRAGVPMGAVPWTPATASMSASLTQELVDWALKGLPNEACGLLAGRATAEDGGTPTRFLALTNAAASPYRYLIDPDEQLRAMLDIDDADEVVWGIVHSHVASPPEPSATDVGLAAYPDALYLICSLASDPPVVRAWVIRDGAVSEVVLHPR